MSSDVHVVPSFHTGALMRRIDDLEPQTLSWLLALLLVLAYTCFLFVSRAWSLLQSRESDAQKPLSQNVPSDPVQSEVSAKGGASIADLLYTECQGDDVTAEQYDAIIVGAGVAGAALAYTLGKVITSLGHSMVRETQFGIQIDGKTAQALHMCQMRTLTVR